MYCISLPPKKDNKKEEFTSLAEALKINPNKIITPDKTIVAEKNDANKNKDDNVLKPGQVIKF